MNPIIVALLAHGVLFSISLILMVINEGNSTRQKVLQVIFSMLVPLVGPALVIAFHVADRKKPGPISDRYMGQSIDEMKNPPIL